MVDKKRNKRLLWLLLFGVGVFNLADYFLTLYAIRRGFKEVNPIMDAILHTAWFPKLKLLLVPFLLLLLWLHHKRLDGRLYYYVGVIFTAYASLMLYYVWLFWRGYL